MTTILYRFYDENENLLYVGITDDFRARCYKHKLTYWWPLVHSSFLEEFESRVDAAAAEVHAIRSELPVYNHVGTKGPEAVVLPPARSTMPQPKQRDKTPRVTIAEAARIAGVSTDTIRRMIARNEIEAKRFGPRLIRVNLASIENAFTAVGRSTDWNGDTHNER